MHFYQQLKSHFDRIDRGLEEKKNTKRIFVEKAKGKTPLVSSRWKENMKTDLR